MNRIEIDARSYGHPGLAHDPPAIRNVVAGHSGRVGGGYKEPSMGADFGKPAFGSSRINKLPLAAYRAAVEFRMISSCSLGRRRIAGSWQRSHTSLVA